MNPGRRMILIAIAVLSAVLLPIHAAAQQAGDPRDMT